MSTTNSGSSVTLTVKTPCMTGNDRELECDRKWTILEVKQQIQRLWDNHPKPEDQRLVYAGKLLENDSTLEDVLRFDDESFTIHLVCRQVTPPRLQTPAAPKTESKPQNETSSDGLRQRNQSSPNHGVSSQQFAEQWMNHMAAPGLQQDHAYWMQHMYAHYMNQYVQYMHAGGSPQNMILPEYYNATAARDPMPEPAPAAPGGNGGAAAPAGMNPPNMVMNAGAGGALGAMEDDDEVGGQRDVLDWFYVASRVLVLFSIVYFYSSFARFAFVAALGILLYLYQVGFFRAGGGVVRANDLLQQQQHAEGVRQAAAGGNPEQPAENAPEAETEEQTEQAAAPEPQPQQPSLLALAATFITTFFSSLIPEQNQVI